MARGRPIPNLSPNDLLSDAARKVIEVRFSEFMTFRSNLLELDGHVDSAPVVHDLRVASRRLRAALEAFQAAMPLQTHRQVVSQVKAVADALGKVRDLDVLTERLRRNRAAYAPYERVAMDSIVTELEASRSSVWTGLLASLETLDASGVTEQVAGFLTEDTY